MTDKITAPYPRKFTHLTELVDGDVKQLFALRHTLPDTDGESFLCTF